MLSPHSLTSTAVAFLVAGASLAAPSLAQTNDNWDPRFRRVWRELLTLQTELVFDVQENPPAGEEEDCRSSYADGILKTALWLFETSRSDNSGKNRTEPNARYKAVTSPDELLSDWKQVFRGGEEEGCQNYVVWRTDYLETASALTLAFTAMEEWIHSKQIACFYEEDSELITAQGEKEASTKLLKLIDMLIGTGRYPEGSGQRKLLDREMKKEQEDLERACDIVDQAG